MAKVKAKRTQAEVAADVRRTGRPPKAAAERQDMRVTVSLTRAEHARLKAQAKRAGVSLAEYLLRPWRQGG